MAKRKIIHIDDEKCNGCGQCIPNCPEGAIQLIEGKARLVSDLFCDGLGACLGHCPEGAITIEEREAEPYSERKVMENIVKQGRGTIIAHLRHLKEHNEMGYLREAMEVLQERNIKVSPQEVLGEGAGCHGGGCPGSAERKIPAAARKGVAPAGASLKGTLLKGTPMSAELTHWPVQLNLVSPMASFLEDADLLIAADCVPFAYPDFHRGLLAGKVLVVGCPKLDNTQAYREKLTQIFTHRNIRSVTYAHMEVPCCFGLIPVIEEALAASGKEIPFSQVTVSIQGELIDG